VTKESQKNQDHTSENHVGYLHHSKIKTHLNDMSVEEERAELVLEQAEPNEAANVAEGVQSHIRGATLSP
jgi:hypothetical protein